MDWTKSVKRLATIAAAVCLAGCAPVIDQLKAAREQKGAGLHEMLSNSIHGYGFSHGIRSVREDTREVDTILVAIPLDALKRQFENLHHMLFNVGRLCARPEFSKVAIQIELNAGDESDREYMRGIVAPLVKEARNVTVITQRDSSNDLVITLTYDVVKKASGGAGAAAH